MPGHIRLQAAGPVLNAPRGHSYLNDTGGLPPGTKGGGQVPGPSIRGEFARAFDLPRELVMDVARVTVVGNFQLMVENHRGLIEFTAERVCVGVHLGQLEIAGRELTIAFISSEGLAVVGDIRGLAFIPASDPHSRDADNAPPPERDPSGPAAHGPDAAPARPARPAPQGTTRPRGPGGRPS